MVTIFKNISETSTPFYKDVLDVLDRIKAGKSKDLVMQIRDCPDKKDRNLLKKKLPAICFSGRFSKRADESIIDHSGIICLDFDGFKTVDDMMRFKDEICDDKFTMSAFISPSGDGVKVLVKIPKDIENHRRYFLALEKHYNNEHFDTSCKNISRVCYESFDEDIYINEFSLIWDTLEDEEHVQHVKSENKGMLFLTDKPEIISRLESWWNKRYGMVDGAKNNNLFILASALNSFGINKDMAEFVLLRYDEGGKKEEILNVCRSAYKNVEDFGTKAFEDTNSIDRVRKSIKSGASLEEIKSIIPHKSHEDVEAVVQAIKSDSSSVQFWQKDEKGRVYMIPHMFKEFLEDSGFFKFYPEGSKNFVFVRVKNNLVYNSSEDEIKDFVMSHLLDMSDLTIFNFFADKTKYFKEDFLSILSSIDIVFKSDSKSESYLYYTNCAVKIKRDDVELIDYLDLDGYVWADQVINRDFKLENVSNCDFSRFISNISGGDSRRIQSVESTIGFLLSGYKDPSYCPAVVINDEVISDNPEGGTGKGLFVQAISRIKKTVSIDGKRFDFNKSFAYQLVSADTQTICFDDINKGFDFEKLFSVITEGITLEKKNKDAIKIPFEHSPKIIITTNYALKGSGNSFDRRKWELEFRRYYTMDFTPKDEAGRMFFVGWDIEEWTRFDNYMISCLQKYMSSGFIKSEFKNLNERKFIAETDHSFWEWITDKDCEYNKSMVKYNMKDLYNKFTEEYPDFAPKSRYSLTLNRFYKWLDSYAMFSTNKKPLSGRDQMGKWIMFQHKEEKEKQITLDF